MCFTALVIPIDWALTLKGKNILDNSYRHEFFRLELGRLVEEPLR